MAPRGRHVYAGIFSIKGDNMSHIYTARDMAEILRIVRTSAVLDAERTDACSTRSGINHLSDS